MLKKTAIVVMLIAASLLIINVAPVSAQGLITTEDLPETIGAATGGEFEFRALARTIINYFLTFLGFVAVIMIIYGGVTYMTAAGAQEKIDSAKKILIYAAVGLIVVLLSFAIVATILGAGTGGGAV